MIDPGPVRTLLRQFETDIQNANRITCEEEIGIRSRNAGNEVREGIKAALNQYVGLQYVTEDDPSIKSLPPEIRDAERRVRNAPVRQVVKALEFCKQNPRANGESLKKLRDTKFRGWPAHLSIEVIPDLLKYGSTFMKIAAIQAQFQNDPEPIPDSLLSTAPQSVEAVTSAADEPLPEETRIDDE